MSARVFVEPSSASPGMWVVGEFLANGWYKSHGRHATPRPALQPNPDWNKPKSCPTRIMDGRNEIRCWLNEGHEGDCR